jgi:hypothetical protein
MHPTEATVTRPDFFVVGDFAVHNESKRVRSGTLQRLIYTPPAPAEIERLSTVINRDLSAWHN